MICSDHQPHNEDAKQAPFSNTQPGISSIELLIPLIMDLVDSELIDLNSAIAKVTSNPCYYTWFRIRCYRTRQVADLCILKKEEWVFKESNIISLPTKYSVYWKKIYNIVDKTICNGKIIYEKK